MTQVEAKCSLCQKTFSVPIKKYNQYQKLHWKIFCSLSCRSKSRMVPRIEQKCQQCGDKINIRAAEYRRNKSKHFFCNQSCSAIFHNKIRGPKSEAEKQKIKQSMKKYWSTLSPGQKILTRDKLRKSRIYNNGGIEKICSCCGKTFRYSINKFARYERKFCSRNCYNIFCFGSLPYTKDQIINEILKMHSETNLTPQKRSCNGRLYHAAIRFFGTWNKFIKSCGLNPNRGRYRTKHLKCRDGHKSDSLSEKIIDDWLYANNILHERSKKYPNTKLTCDFYLVDSDLWVEYFGLYDVKEYQDTMKIKQNIAKQNHFRFLALTPQHLYDNQKTNYDDKLRKIFRPYLSPIPV